MTQGLAAGIDVWLEIPPIPAYKFLIYRNLSD